MGIEGKLLVSRKNIVVNKESIGINNDLTKDRNVKTFKTYCKRRKSGARFPDRKANNRLCACHCIAGNAELEIFHVCLAPTDYSHDNTLQCDHPIDCLIGHTLGARHEAEDRHLPPEVFQLQASKVMTCRCTILPACE